MQEVLRFNWITTVMTTNIIGTGSHPDRDAAACDFGIPSARRNPE